MIHRWTLRVAALTLGAASTLHVGAAGSAPEASLARLRAGNARFIGQATGEAPADAAPLDRVPASPTAAVLSCSDATVTPEQLFDAAPGELFVVRVAGHVTDRAVLASLELATEQLRVPLVVVMGHDQCSAVKTTVAALPGQSFGPNLDYMIKAIKPAVGRVAGSADAQRLRAAILANVEESINAVLDDSAILRHLAEQHRIGLIGAYYDGASGRVLFSTMVDAPLVGREPADRH